VKAILLIDDEAGVDMDAPPAEFAGYMWYYLRALLDHGYEVVQATSVDRALEELTRDASRFGLAIVDIMMPPGRAFASEDTRYGLRTGVFLIDRLAVEYPQLPVVVLTNIDNSEDLESLRSRKDVREVSRKPWCTPFEFVKVVRRIMEGHNVTD
jgi:CheY-like chemotaxis protein